MNWAGAVMAGVLDSVNQRTQLVGQNRLELLLFRLAGKQLYGLNVFKVKEVLQCPPLNQIPKRHPVVRGVAHIRGGTISIMDMNLATGHGPLGDLENCFVIITEYNRSTQGFLVSKVERIINMNWEHIHPPPKGSGNENYLTAVTEVEGQLVEIIELKDHPWFLACQFHPEFTSNPRDWHPLFTGFITAAREHQGLKLPQAARA